MRPTKALFGDITTLPLFFLYKKGGESPRRSVDQGLTTSPSLQYQYHKPIVCICYHANSDLSNKKYSNTAPREVTSGAASYDFWQLCSSFNRSSFQFILGHFHYTGCYPFCKSSFFLILSGHRCAPPPAQRVELSLLHFPVFPIIIIQKQKNRREIPGGEY